MKRLEERKSLPAVLPSKLQAKPSTARFPRPSGDQGDSLLETRKHKKAKALTAGKYQEAATAVVSDPPKTPTDTELLTQALSRHFLFSTLTPAHQRVIIEAMKEYRLGPHDIVCEQGQAAAHFFVVASGQLEVLGNGRRVNTLQPGDGFGELALLQEGAHSTSIKTLQDCVLWAVDGRTFRQFLQMISQQNYAVNRAFIESIQLFAVLTDREKDQLVNAMTSQHFDAGQPIVTEGDSGELFYIIKEGVVSCSQAGKEVRRLSKGDFFGEQALLYGGKRTATVTAVNKPVECVCIRREELEQALGSHLQQVIYRNTQRMALERCHELQRLSKEQTERLITHMRVSCYSSGQVVIPKGQAKDAKLWIVLKGALGPNKVNVVAERLECLGAQSEGVFAETLVAIGEQVHIAEIDKEGLQQCLEGEMSQAATEALAALKHVPLLKGLNSERLAALARLLRTEDFKDGTVVFKQGTPGDTFFIVKSGKVEVVKDGVAVRTIARLDYFGERSVLQEEVRTASVVARGTAVCWVLHRDDLLSVINDHVRNSLLKRMELQDDSVSLSNLAAVRPLGKGTYGHVFLVSRLPRGPLYALKTISRRKVEGMGLETNVQLERRLMLQLDHPFMTSLIRTFKDTKRLYFLLEYVEGPDLFDVLRILGLLSDSGARFYTATVLLMLEHLHEHNIIYRDLKPENLMIDSEGYPKLIDFGTAKCLSGRTYTITGTPHYMAPEVILGKGYGLPADLWSLGVMLYEFVCGGLPFGEEEEEPYAIYEKVLQRRLTFPRVEVSSRSLIEQLLTTNPVLRFSGGWERLKAHSWFSGFSWVRAIQDQLLDRELQPPYVPPPPAPAHPITTASLLSVIEVTFT